VPDEWITVDEPGTRWRFERSFLESNWTCIWGRGCLGIDEVPAPELARGCCSVGAEMDGVGEAMNVSALADTLSADVFQFREVARRDGLFSDQTRTNTRVVDGACILLNRPGFPGGAGCALHIAALAAGESPLDWKPSVCWQLPIKVDWEDGEPIDGQVTEIATVRRWSRADWGEDGEIMAWCCTEGQEAYVGDRPVIDSLAEELAATVGSSVFVELRRRVRDGT
jgi:hypothetical protein